MEEPTKVTLSTEEMILSIVQSLEDKVDGLEDGQSEIKAQIATHEERSQSQGKRIERVEKAGGAVALAVFIGVITLLSGCNLFSLPAPATPATPAPVVNAVQRAVDNTVAIHAADDEHRFCSGVVVESAILTATHCVNDGEGFKIWYQGAMYDGVVVSKNEKTDLAVIAAVGARLKHSVPLATQTPVLGNKVIWMGYPMAQDFIMGTGIVGNPSIDLGPSRFMAVYGQFIPGNSGGPVFNYKGELVGIVSMTMAYRGQLLPVGYAVPLDIIKAAL